MSLPTVPLSYNLSMTVVFRAIGKPSPSSSCLLVLWSLTDCLSVSLKLNHVPDVFCPYSKMNKYEADKKHFNSPPIAKTHWSCSC